MEQCLCENIPSRLIERLQRFLETNNIYQLREFEREILSFVDFGNREAEVKRIDKRLEI